MEINYIMYYNQNGIITNLTCCAELMQQLAVKIKRDKDLSPRAISCIMGSIKASINAIDREVLKGIKEVHG
jgi:hypothetical protein